MLYKNKRAHKQNTSPNYLRQLEKLYEVGWTFISPEVSARKVIAAADLAISYPFTSTALIAEDLGIPSIYYDPSGTITDEDEAKLAGRMISSKAALKHYIQDLFHAS